MLEYDEHSGNWFYKIINNEARNKESSCKASKDVLSWKHNIVFELVDKEFTGVVTRIAKTTVSNFLGVYDNTRRDAVSAFSLYPVRVDGFGVLAATVYYGNNRKRLVPLECIKGCNDFTNGKKIEALFNNMKLANKGAETDNAISFLDDGSIQIENTSFFLGDESHLSRINRRLLLNPIKHVSRIFAHDDGWFNISDSEYSEILSYMKKSVKEDCGFEPSAVYGETNFDRLVNFAAFPFAPEINAFRKLFGESFPCHSLNNIHEGVKTFITMCGIAYTPRINKIFLRGHRDFSEFLGLWACGFKDMDVINRILSADKYRFFSTAVFGYGAIEINGFRFKNKPLLIRNVEFLFTLYDEHTVAKLIIPLFYHFDEGRVPWRISFKISDSVSYMSNLQNENALSEDVIKKIKNEGFTTYNHDLLMRTWIGLHPEKNGETTENQIIQYTDAEKQLEWKTGDYDFALPDDTDTLRRIGSQMSICVGHLYSKKAVEKRCTIVYALKNEKYQLCIELSKKSNNSFHLFQVSAFSNHKPKGRALAAFNKWLRVKNIA